MKKQRFLSLFLIVVLCLTLTPAAFAADNFDVNAKAALLVDVGSGEVLYEKNSRERNYPASITKVMTALLVLEAVDAGQLRLDQEITASEGAFVGLAADGSTASIKPGETMTVDDLLNCMLIVSANEATHILAEAVSGSVQSFVVQMHRRAEQQDARTRTSPTPPGCMTSGTIRPRGISISSPAKRSSTMFLSKSARARLIPFRKRISPSRASFTRPTI